MTPPSVSTLLKAALRALDASPPDVGSARKALWVAISVRRLKRAERQLQRTIRREHMRREREEAKDAAKESKSE